MTLVPAIPDNAPFSPEQRAWLNGYLAGLFARAPIPGYAATAAPAAAAKPAAPVTPLTILFGSQTGTAEGLAKKAAKEAGKRGFAATVHDLGAYTTAQLAQEKSVLVITSTYGDGEPPDNAKAFHAAVAALANDPAAARLSALRFSVCGLGDTNYIQFCQCAKDFDAHFEKLGAMRVSPRVDCDLDYDAKFAAWLDAALAAFGSGAPVAAVADRGHPAQTSTSAVEEDSGYSRKNPFPALLVTSRTLNGAGSAKQVQHVELSLEGSGLVYEAGDALGVYAHNCPEHVAEVLAALGCDGEEAVPAPDGATLPLRRALTEFYDLGKPTPELIASVVAEVADLGPRSPTAATKTAPHHVIDVLLAAPGAKLAPTDFVKLLRRLQPRLYSISSSPKAHAGQVHLTVGAVRYDKDGRARKGVCSTFLADRAVPGQTRVGVFVHSNKAFRPPADPDVPAIMIGPGTGIAPFRAFLAERKATGAKGRNWLFFGDQRAEHDYLYREELATLLLEGVLTRIDTAFSRDQAEKIYVQHRMLENAAELFAWLEAGAHVYVCGDASRMAKDVDAALHKVIETAGGRTPEQAADYVQALKSAKRYARDVY